MKQSDWNSCIDYERNEIVFENRNKIFGAYVIRRDYSRNVLLAFFTACLLMCTLFIPFFLKSLQSKSTTISEKFSEVINLEIYTPPPVELTPPSITEQSPSQISKELTNPVVVEDRIATTDIQMIPSNIVTLLLPSNGRASNTTISSGTSGPIIPEIIPENVVKKWAEIMPKFPGGDDKLVPWLSSNIRYPSGALIKSIEGTVYISFVVDTSGLITNVKLIHGIYEACDQEAIKAVKNMPRWIPGSQNGNKVSVELSLPVHFTIK